MIRWIVLTGLLALCNGELTAQKAFMMMFHDERVSVGENLLLDDFKGDQLNDSLWYGYYPWGGLSIDAQTYTDPQQCQQRNGVLYLTVDTTTSWRSFPDWMVDTAKLRLHQQEGKDGKIKIKRLTAALWSKSKVKYGFFECRCWLPSGKGFWPAFWLYGGEPNEEIDFMEGKGEREKSYHVDIHCPNHCDRIKTFGVFDKPFGHWVKVREGVLGSWVVFSGLWTPSGVLFYYNNQLKAVHEAQFNTSMNVIANMSLAMDKGPFSPGPNEKTPFPTPFKIDYIRTWKVPDAALNLALPTLKKAAFLTCVHLGEDQMLFERVGAFEKGDRVFIEHEEKPIIELDLTKEQQYIDAHFWKKGEYTIRAIRGTSTTQATLIRKN